MTVRCRALLILVSMAVLAGPRAWAQDSDAPREFTELRGTWILDEAATEGLRRMLSRTGESRVFDGLGFPVAQTLVIATTPTEMSVTKDSGLPEVYRFDGTETQVRDPRTGAPLAERYRFTLVAELLALTLMRPRADMTEILTDAYSLTEWTVLRVERQLSYLGSEGHLRTLSGRRNDTQSIVYRRQPAPGR
jgi:hypothetical protein